MREKFKTLKYLQQFEPLKIMRKLSMLTIV